MTDPKPSTSSADDRINELDKKWADRFNRLEALLLAKSIDQPEPTFQAPKVAPTHPPPVGAVKSSALFLRPSTDQPTKSDLSGTGHSTSQGRATSKSLQTSKLKRSAYTDLPCTDSKKQSTSKSPQIQPNTDRPSDLSGTGSPVVYQVTSKSTSAPAMAHSDSSMDTDTDSICPTGHQSTSLLKRGSSLTQTRTLLPTPTRRYLRIKPTEKRSGYSLLYGLEPDSRYRIDSSNRG